MITKYSFRKIITLSKINKNKFKIIKNYNFLKKPYPTVVMAIYFLNIKKINFF